MGVPPDNTEGATFLFGKPIEGTPRRIGRYDVVERIGAGGMGDVFLARQEEPVRRDVAVKLLRADIRSSHDLARFEVERQALALMDHPGIAHVYDAGVTDAGRPYFVMEYVRGVPMTQYCDEHRLTTEERIELLRAVCGAVQHAHQKAVIHRDLKPSNVLVAIEQGEPMPKVIDFGVAKPTEQALTDRTLQTVVGQIIGTPEYMSPEQAEMTNLDVDIRADVYSLGVLLYELLTGRLPFSGSLRDKALVDVQRILRDEIPRLPSTRITRLSGEDSLGAARDRRTDPAALVRALRGDLDWIVTKAMEKDRARRYDSVAAFSEDLGRYLRSEPVAARPPSVRYRAGRFVKRNRTGVIAAAAVGVALLTGIVATTWMAVIALEQRDQANWKHYLAGIQHAKVSIETGDVLTAIDQLLGVPEALRGWEWYHLWHRCNGSLDEFPVGSSPVGLAVNQDGVLAAADYGSLALWQVADMSSAAPAAAPRRQRTLAISDDPQWLLVTGGDPTKPTRDVLRWNSMTGEYGPTVMQASQSDLDIGRFRLGPKGRYAIASLGGEGALSTLIDVAAPEHAPIEIPSEIAYAFSHEGSGIAIGSNPVTVLTMTDGVEARRFVDPLSTDRVTALAFDAGSYRLAVGYADSIVIWPARRDAPPLARLEGGADRFAWSADSKTLAVAQGLEIRIYRPSDSPSPTARFHGHRKSIEGLVFAPNGALFSIGYDGTMRRWPTVDPIVVARFESVVWAVPLDGGHALISHGDRVTGSAEIRNVETGAIESALDVGSFSANLAASPDGSFVAASLPGARVQVWRSADNELVEAFDIEFDAPAGGSMHSVSAIGFTVDSAYIVAADNVGGRLPTRGESAPVVTRLCAWSTGGGEPVEVFSSSESIHAIARRESSDELAVAEGSTVVFLDANLQRSGLITFDAPVLALDFDPTGRRVVAAVGQVLIVRDIDGGSTLTLLDQPTQHVAWHPDGARIATADGSSVRVWDAGGGDQIMAFDVDGHVVSLGFTPDGERLVAATAAGTVMSWQAPAANAP